MLGDGLRCARGTGALLHVLRMLIARAQLLDLSGDRPRAIEDMIEALTLAAYDTAYGAFLENRGSLPLLRAVVRHAQDSYVDILVVDFASNIVARLARVNEDRGEAGLSLREREVLEELAQGRSNKEIARLLDMTEHTVKFHLKNLFAKLDVARRTQAVARARELGLI
ncbi:LuxR C-terminal-related transcriptional regulator [Sphingomonas colocasiae]|uniref:LuxR C-terminal-related transcriptional regulator n=2 Tax=Sphingomonas colocasiae TaxID=1848973 RepID=A0ABS7PKF7_9SPHN|nr:LuxR C-terminal-related transcriptional regulator [Sphingomonas colocasiae]